MIGMELLNLMYGDPLAQAMRPPQPAPNPNPQPVPGAPPGVPPMTPAQMAGMKQAGDFPRGAPGAPPSPSGGQGQPSPPPSLPQSGPPSTAPQSPQDLGQLYLQLMQRDRAANAIDRGLAGMAVSLAAPGYQGAIAQAMAPQQYDAGQDMKTLMQLQYMSQMANMPAPPGIDPAIWRGLSPDAKLKTFEQAAQSGIDIAKTGATQKQTDFINAQKAAPGAISQLGQVDSVANQIIGAKDASGNPIMKSITDSAFKRGAAQTMLDDATAKEPLSAAVRAAHSVQINSALTDEEKGVINNLIQLRGQIYGEEFKNAGSKRTQGEIGGLVSGASQVFSLNQPYENYAKQFGAFQNQLHKTYNNTLGEAGRVDEIPQNMRWDMSDPNNPKPLVDTAFLQGGDQYHGGGQWAMNPPKTQVASGGAPQAAVAYLMAHPELASQFDAKYGQGAAAGILHAR